MVNGEAARKQPYVVSRQQPWVNELVVSQHVEALWLYGENCVYTLMWRAQDEEAGLVQRCSHCYVNDRGAQAFKQPGSKKGCIYCYGTTFEGGIRAQLVRPTIFSDRNIETKDTERGTLSIDSLQVETTPDFLFRSGDYIFRGDGSRYQAEQKGEAVLRTGFGTPKTTDSFRGTIPVARLEDPTSVAYIIPPNTPDLIALLGGPVTSEDLSGEPTLPIPTSEQTYAFDTPTLVWECNHTLGSAYPSVLTIDSAGEQMIGQVEYLSPTHVRITWFQPVSGRAILKV